MYNKYYLAKESHIRLAFKDIQVSFRRVDSSFHFDVLSGHSFKVVCQRFLNNGEVSVAVYNSYHSLVGHHKEDKIHNDYRYIGFLLSVFVKNKIEAFTIILENEKNS